MRTVRQLTCIMLAHGVLLAQQPAAGAARRAPDPSFQNSRFDELWPAAPGAGGVRAFKHLSVAPHDAAWLTVGGSVRYRGSSYRNFQISPNANMQDDYSETRAVLSADLWMGRPSAAYGRIFAEVRDAQGYGRTLPGGLRTNELDREDWQNAFAEAGWGVSGVRYGRQELSLARERLVGVSDWANSRRAFEGGKVMSRVRDVRLEVFEGRVVAVRSLLPDRPDSTTRFRMAAASTVKDRGFARTWRPAGWQAYAMQLRSDAGLSERTTIGARSLWKLPVRRAQVSVEVEAASQRGHIKTRAVDAWFSVVEGTATWRGRRWAPSLIAGIDAGSGTGRDSLHHADAFQPPYATSHGFTGIADLLGRGNLVESRIGFGVEPRKTIQAQVMVRHFSRMSLRDGVYSKTNTRLRGPGESGSHAVGDEGDVVVTWAATAHVKLQGGAALVLPGAFLRETAGGSSHERFAYISTTVTF